MSINKTAKQIIADSHYDRLLAFKLAKSIIRDRVIPCSIRTKRGVMALQIISVDGLSQRTEENKDEKVLIEGRLFPEFFQ